MLHSLHDLAMLELFSSSSSKYIFAVFENDYETRGYDCEFVIPLLEAFKIGCPISLLVLKEPCIISCPCGQKICRECIEKIRKDKKPCLLCTMSAL